ncbi:hypothetical protein ABT147_21080 [Streptomyces sp. NPDC001868]|uniref:hypothetical protein n=1 Tax=Streptomyces sp. NPDC001868 TaxID=3154401 RepID=UPI00331C7144
MADLLRITGRDWDRRAHRIAVLAQRLPTAIPQRWTTDRPADVVPPPPALPLAAPHAEAVTDLNILAFALTRAHRPAEAAPVFGRLGRQPERTFVYWRDRSKRSMRSTDDRGRT